MPPAPEAEATTPERDPRPRARVSPRALGLIALIALVAYGLDQGTKWLVEQHIAVDESVPVLGEFLQLHHVLNSGAAFSLASGFTWVLSIVVAIVIVFLIAFAPRIRSLAWATMFGLVIGGAFGNLTDRLFRPPSFGQGHVVDFIQVQYFPAIFNVADIAVTSAMGLFVLLSLRGLRLDGTREPKRAARAAGADEPES